MCLKKIQETLQLELMLSSGTVCVSMYSMIAGIFGMNIPYTWNDDHGYIFKWVRTSHISVSRKKKHFYDGHFNLISFCCCCWRSSLLLEHFAQSCSWLYCRTLGLEGSLDLDDQRGIGIGIDLLRRLCEEEFLFLGLSTCRKSCSRSRFRH